MPPHPLTQPSTKGPHQGNPSRMRCAHTPGHYPLPGGSGDQPWRIRQRKSRRNVARGLLNAAWVLFCLQTRRCEPTTRQCCEYAGICDGKSIEICSTHSAATSMGLGCRECLGKGTEFFLDQTETCRRCTTERRWKLSRTQKGGTHARTRFLRCGQNFQVGGGAHTNSHRIPSLGLRERTQRDCGATKVS